MNTILITTNKRLFDSAVRICRNEFKRFHIEVAEGKTYRLVTSLYAQTLIESLNAFYGLQMPDALFIDCSYPIPHNRLALYQNQED